MENKLRGVASFDQREMMELENIILDKDYEEAYIFLKEKVWERVNEMRKEHAEHERNMAQVKSKPE